MNKFLNYTSKLFIIFLTLHFILWIFLPTIFNPNLPLDVIENIIWGQEWQLGYHKHPPLAAWISAFAFYLLGNANIYQYLLSQIFICLGFIYIYKITKIYLEEKIALIATISVDLIFYYNYTSPEFNPNILLISFFPIFTWYFYRVMKFDYLRDWLILSVIATLSIYAKYYAVFLIFSAFIFLITTQEGRNKFKNYKIYLSISLFIILLAPHVKWLFDNNFIPIEYALARTEDKTQEYCWLSHIYNPLKFFLSQIINLSLFIIILTFIYAYFYKKKSILKNHLNKQKFEDKFLIIFTFLPFILTLILSLTTGAKIKTMWGASLWYLLPILIFYLFPIKFNDKSFKIIILTIIISNLMIALTYGIIMNSQLHKRAHFNGVMLSNIIENEWKNYHNDIPQIIAGDMWLAGNFSVYSKSHPSVWIDFDKRKSPWVKQEKEPFIAIYYQDEFNYRIKNIESYFADRIIIRMPDIYLNWYHYHNNKPTEIISWAIVK